MSKNTSIKNVSQKNASNNKVSNNKASRNKASKKNTLIKLLSYIKGSTFYVFLSFLCAAISVIATLYIPRLTADAIDLIVGPGRVDFDKMLPVLIKTGIIILVTALVQWIMNLCNNKLIFKIVKDVRKRAFNKLHSLPFAYLDSKPHGDLVSRIISDTDQISDGLLMGFSQIFSGILTIVMALIFMVILNYKIALIVVCITPLSLFIASFIGKHTYSMFKEQSEARGELTGLTNEMVGNQKLVHAFAYEGRAIDRFEIINERLRVAGLKATFFSSLINPTTRLVNNIVSACVVLAGAVAVLNGNLTVGGLSCFINYSNQYTKPFNDISSVITELQNALASAARVFELIDEASEIPDSADAVNYADPQEAIYFKNVSFSYSPDKPLIEDMNLTIKPGQRVAIVGPTGCGKTTLINLIMRFYDVTGGKLCFDDTDIRDMTRHSLRDGIGMVLQDTWLMSGTIRDNIAYGKPNATDEEIIAAAKASHAHSFIKRLPDGYNTTITEDGGNLSQGQKQLLCITRVMLSLPPVLILDEATSSIDTRTEIRIQKAFAKMMEGRTSFIVAHRLSTIKEADIILVMKDGHIIEQGNHESLLAEGGFYSELYHSQYC